MPRTQTLQKLAHLAASVKTPHTTRVAIDGVSAAGKTILADQLARQIASHQRPVIRASLDGFHHPAAVRHRRGSHCPEGYYHDSFDFNAVREKLLIPLGPGGDGVYRVAQHDLDAEQPVRSKQETALPGSILLFDGVFLMRSELVDHWDFRIFVHAEFDVILARALARDTARLGSEEATRQKYLSRYIPGQQHYLQTVHPEELADVIVYNDEPQWPHLHVMSAPTQA